jgi:glycosyltransferase involved in cell wall biosynthesis
LEQPFFSIVIPCYNSESYLQETLKSIKEQSFQDFEVVLVDDHSTDTSLQQAQRLFKDLGLRGKQGSLWLQEQWRRLSLRPLDLFFGQR